MRTGPHNRGVATVDMSGKNTKTDKQESSSPIPEYIVTVDSIGGATVLSCDPLGIKNIEYPFKEIYADGIKKTILDYKYMSEKSANFDLSVQDNRPDPHDYHKKKAEESKILDKRKNKLAGTPP